jgi:RNA polymerase sigma-70 factor (ECF subfamily)
LIDSSGTGAAQTRRFESLVMPHLDAAYNLARWLTRSDADADDVVQEACLKAFRFVDQCRAENPRGWFLAIVRNAAYSWLRNKRPQELVIQVGADDELAELAADPATPESLALDGEAIRRLDEAIGRLPVPFREVVVLREQEELSYKEIAELTGMPIGTVMSRLARGRSLLAKALGRELPAPHGQEPKTSGDGR